MIRRIPIFVNGKTVIFEKTGFSDFFYFECLYLTYFNSGSIVNRQKFDPGIEKQNCQILW